VHFDITVQDSHGVLRMLSLSALSESDAAAAALAGGFRVLGVTQQAMPASVRRHAAPLRSSSFEPAQFAEELAALLDAGLSLPESLETLGARETAKLRDTFYAPMARALQEGKPLSAAMLAAGKRLPPLLVATVKASEQTGDMAASLRRYAQTHKRIRVVKDKIISASIYPAILSVAGVAVLFFLLGVVVPRFAHLIDSNGRDIPEASRLLMDWGTLVNRHLLEILIALAVIVAIAVAALAQRRVRAALAAQVTQLPLVGTYVRLYRQSQFWQTSAMLVQGGIPASQAFRMASSLLGGADQERMHQTLARIDCGQELAASFNATGMVDSVTYRMLQVAQKTGQLGRTLGQLASFQSEALERGLDRLTKLVEPILMIAIGLLVGGIVVLMYLPIFDLAASIQ
jgi:general secretion pathway protein F